MKKTILIISILFPFAASCNPESCTECIRCISYNENHEIQNEVRECSDDREYLDDYKEGFIEGANSIDREAICFELGVQCQ